MCRMRATCLAMSSRLYDRWIRFVDGGRLATDSPGCHSVVGRIGRGTKPPPQFGQTLCNLCSTQSAQNVHSYVQMRGFVELGGRSSQNSQLSLSSSAIVASNCRCTRRVPKPRRKNAPRSGLWHHFLLPALPGARKPMSFALLDFPRLLDIHVGDRRVHAHGLRLQGGVERQENCAADDAL
jgi:hypothetical protein